MNMKEEISQLKAQLLEITSTMDVPEYRRESVKWLLRNAAIRNSGHPQFEMVMDVLKKLNSLGVA